MIFKYFILISITGILFVKCEQKNHAVRVHRFDPECRSLNCGVRGHCVKEKPLEKKMICQCFPLGEYKDRDCPSQSLSKVVSKNKQRDLDNHNHKHSDDQNTKKVISVAKAISKKNEKETLRKDKLEKIKLDRKENSMHKNKLKIRSSMAKSSKSDTKSSKNQHNKQEINHSSQHKSATTTKGTTRTKLPKIIRLKKKLEVKPTNNRKN